jgi:hypothetical protein
MIDFVLTSRHSGLNQSVTARIMRIRVRGSAKCAPSHSVAPRCVHPLALSRGLHNLPQLREIGFAANRRLLEIERLSHDRMLAEDTFQSINGPVAAGRQRASGLRFAEPRTHPLLQAVILFRQIAHGFRCDDLRRHLATLSGRAPGQISQGAITYQLRRLRLHGCLPKSFRYRVTDFGLRAALFFTL